MNARSRILLADDHPIVLTGLRNLVEAENDLELVGEAPSGTAAFTLIRATRPDVAVLDISMPGLNGIVLTRKLASEMPDVRVLILTLHEDRAFAKQAIEAGAQGYVLKRSAAECLVQAIRAVIVGGLYVDPAIAGQMFDAGSRRGGQPKIGGLGPDLTDRETEVLKLTALGFTNKEIARQLTVGVKSVETYKARASEKLGLKTRAELVRFAAGQGWLADA
jgi:DNA-binding NarL/FixJ family response regulator